MNDIEKIVIIYEILNKPVKLTKVELDIMKKNSIIIINRF